MTPWTAIRPARESDYGFIIDSWVTSFERYSTLHRKNAALYALVMPHVIRALVRDGVALIAHDPADDDTIVGFACATGGTLHYTFIKSAFRDHDIARSLIDRIGPVDAHSFKTSKGLSRLRPDVRGWSYKPFQMEIT